MIDTVTLRQNLADAYGIAIETIEQLNMGADPTASVYKATAQDQSIYFVKMKQGTHPDLSTIIIDALNRDGVKNVIPCLKTKQGNLYQITDSLTITVFPYIEGQDGFSLNLQERQWRELGKILKKIHSIQLPASIYTQISQETYSPNWPKTLQFLETLLRDLPTIDSIAGATQHLLKDNLPTIQLLMDHANRLSLKIEKNVQDYVLCHGDLHAGNIIIDQTGQIFIIDWDNPILAPKERDLMFIGGGVGNVWNKPSEQKLFYDGYGPVAVNLSLLAYYRVNRILEDIAIYCQLLLQNTDNSPNRGQWYQELVSQFDDKGVITIALETAASFWLSIKC